MDYHVAYPPKTAFEEHQETCDQCGSPSAQLCPVGEGLFAQSLTAGFEALVVNPNLPRNVVNLLVDFLLRVALDSVADSEQLPHLSRA